MDGKPNSTLEGRISCDGIVPYPPGIPILSAGQTINLEILNYLARLIQLGRRNVEIHGLTEEEESGELLVRVLTEEEFQLIQSKRIH